MTKIVWTNLLLLGAITFARADVFSSSVPWEAAVTGVTTIDFGVLAPPLDGQTLLPTPPGVTLSGVLFSSTGSSLAAVNDTFCCSTYARGADTLDSGVNNTIVVTLPANTTAIGFDLFTVNIGDVSGVDSGKADIDVNGTKYVVNTDPAPGLVFFGLTSPNPITSLTITPEQAPIGTAVDLTNFSYGRNAVVTPEPGYYWPAFGIAVLLVAARLRASRRLSAQ